MYDSYRASNDVVKAVTDKLLKYELNNPTNWNRSRNSIVREWIAHNKAYNLHVGRSHSKDVDINNADEEKFLFSLVGGLGYE